jgi:drug/metabolite transporter (DMT)-like permease
MTGELAAIVYGIASAMSWGTADFSGGLASKRASAVSVVITSQIVGILMLFVLALIFDPQFPPFSHILIGGLAGIFGVLSLLGFYRLLADGRMGIAAPLTAVTTAAVPALVGTLVYGLPGVSKLVGFGLALAGIWLISQTKNESGGGLALRDLILPLAIGAGFGMLFVLIDQANDIAIFWPLVGARAASLTMMISITLMRRQPLFTETKMLPLVAFAGILDAGGNGFFALAANAGRLDIAGVLGSLYPAATILLAYFVLKEPISRIQSAGIVAALAAVALIAI